MYLLGQQALHRRYQPPAAVADGRRTGLCRRAVPKGPYYNII